MTDLIRLAERVEAEIGTSFAINQEIARLEFYREEHGDFADDEVPDFTGSLDASLTLIQEGRGWNLQGNTNLFYAVVFGHYSKPCAIPALALTAAALRSLAAQRGQG